MRSVHRQRASVVGRTKRRRSGAPCRKLNPLVNMRVPWPVSRSVGVLGCKRNAGGVSNGWDFSHWQVTENVKTEEGRTTLPSNDDGSLSGFGLDARRTSTRSRIAVRIANRIDHPKES